MVDYGRSDLACLISLGSPALVVAAAGSGRVNRRRVRVGCDPNDPPRLSEYR
jgi:hypothetical protein